MEKFKGLEVPGTDNNPVESINAIQKAYCDKAKCGGACCTQCIFDEKHIEEFKEWYKSHTSVMHEIPSVVKDVKHADLIESLVKQIQCLTNIVNELRSKL